MSGDVLVSGGSDGVIRIWNLNDFTCVERYAAHDNSVSSLCYEAGRIISGGTDGRVRIWESSTGHIRDLASRFEAVWCVTAKDERVVALASRDQHIYMELMSFVPPLDVENYDGGSLDVSKPSELLQSSVPPVPPPPPPPSDLKLDPYVDPKDSSVLAHDHSTGSLSTGEDGAMDLSN
jgi:F-box and WD-40 domain protein CDC4